MTKDQETILHGMVSFAGVTHVGDTFTGDPVVRDRDGKLWTILPDGDTLATPESVLTSLLPINPK